MLLNEFSFICSPSYSYLINYEIQSSMYNWLDENTEETEYLKSAGMGVLCASTTVTTVTRIVAIAEICLLGLGTFLTAPFTATPIENAKIGLHEVFVHTPKNILRTAAVFLEFIVGTIYVLNEPKSFTMQMAEYMKRNLRHARNGTIHSAKHQDDLGYVAGVVKPKFMEYQARTWQRLHPGIQPCENPYKF